MSEPVLLHGNAHPELAASVARELGIAVMPCSVSQFPDGETAVTLIESVRRRDVFVLHPTAPPVNQRLIELLAIADACRRAAAGRVIAVIPYFGYARSDRRGGVRVPVMGRLAADLLEAAGVQHVVTFDLHAPQIEGFFSVPIDHLSAAPVLTQALQALLPLDVAVVAPDAGAMRLATSYAHDLGVNLVVVHKRRVTAFDTVPVRIVGDVRDRPVLVVDDMISTGSTIVNTVEALLAAGARPDVTIAATHGLFVDHAQERLDVVEAISRVVVTDSVPVHDQNWMKLRVVSLAPSIAGAIRRISGAAAPSPLAEESCLATSSR